MLKGKGECMNRFLKNEKGIVGADIAIALSILMLFAFLLASLYLNTNNSAMSIQRTAMATELITNVFEKIDLMYYDEIKETPGDNDYNLTADYSNMYQELKSLVNKKGYDTTINIKQYKQEGETDTADLIKKIVVTVKYKVRKKRRNYFNG